jgi:exopolysaccharide production protein ExoY
MILFDIFRDFLSERSDSPSNPFGLRDQNSTYRGSATLERLPRFSSQMPLGYQPAADSSPDTRRRLPTAYAKAGKRAVDFLLAIIMLPTILLVMLVAWPFVVRDGGPMFYRHPRVGRNGKVFGCLKIRTMRTDSAEQLALLLSTDPKAAREWAETQKLDKDPRITRFGHVLRKTSIDELPQLWNVITGDMSLVGPRPVTAAELDRYGEARDAYTSVRPGITGLWQIAPSRYDMTYAERVELDVSYARSVSFAGDLRILWGTVIWAINPNGK